MTRPWMKFFTRDWLDSKELRRCSTVSRSILIDLMALAHEGERYGYLNDAIGPLTEDFMASRCSVSVPELLRSIAELTKNKRLNLDGDALFVPRMVADEELRLKRAAGGHLGGNPALSKVNHKANNEVNHTPGASSPNSDTRPLMDNHEVNHDDNHEVNHDDNHEVNHDGVIESLSSLESTKDQTEGYPCGYPCFEIDSRARVLADSDSVSNTSIKPESSNTLVVQKNEVPSHILSSPSWVLDETYSSFVQFARKLWPRILEEEISEGYHWYWNKLSVGDRLTALKNIQLRVTDRQDGTYITKMPNYLKYEWKRNPDAPKKVNGHARDDGPTKPSYPPLPVYMPGEDS